MYFKRQQVFESVRAAWLFMPRKNKKYLKENVYTEKINNFFFIQFCS